MITSNSMCQLFPVDVSLFTAQECGQSGADHSLQPPQADIPRASGPNPVGQWPQVPGSDLGVLQGTPCIPRSSLADVCLRNSPEGDPRAYIFHSAEQDNAMGFPGLCLQMCTPGIHLQGIPGSTSARVEQGLHSVPWVAPRSGPGTQGHRSPRSGP